MRSENCLCVLGSTILAALGLVVGTRAQQENAPTQPASSPEVVTVSDGTPITLRLEKALSSANAKVGDPVQFTVAVPVLAHAFIVVPQGTTVSGTVVEVRHRGHFGKNGEFRIAIHDLALPVGKSVSVRQELESTATKHNHNARKATGEVTRAVVGSVPFFGVTLPMMAAAWGFQKGVEQVYPAGYLVAAYINRPIAVNRSELAPYRGPREGPTQAAQVSFKNDGCTNHADSDPVYLSLGNDFLLVPCQGPHKGPVQAAQVFFKNEGCTEKAGCDPVTVMVGRNFLVGELFEFLRVELKPGTYSFSTDKTKVPLQLELLANRQYWVERKQDALIADDPEHHRDEIDKVESYPWIRDRNLVDTVLPLR